ncbi:LysR family transcriptional regulator [Bradyrhizobium canariense]|uniref:LysR family transcriptional regulator n=1 Tax=Bradyrhizobium canariense TaxID=255045 RepID=UPI001C67FEF0|nr:LysR family transcriptional regulator [Bradyrhizobium canariense]MBW5435781.1 LysR family transcriptional regulator [Bradyrhizobium canariense]
MRFNGLDLNLLVALDVLLEEKNVSRAAGRLNITQSALSNSLARLRDYFDDEILVLVGRTMQLTPHGEALKDSIRDILVRIEASVIAKPAFDPATSDRLFKISASDFTLATLMPLANKIISTQCNSIRLHFLPQTDNPTRSLERGDVDILIIPSPYSSEEHPSHQLFTEEFVCIADRNNPLCQNDHITLQQFSDAQHVALKLSHGKLSFETMAMEEIAVQRNISTLSYNFSTLPYLVLGTNKIATIHRRLASTIAKKLPVKVFGLPFDFPKMHQVLQWHKYRSNDQGLIWLRGVFQEAAKKLSIQG